MQKKTTEERERVKGIVLNVRHEEKKKWKERPSILVKGTIEDKIVNCQTPKKKKKRKHLGQQKT